MCFWLEFFSFHITNSTAIPEEKSGEKGINSHEKCIKDNHLCGIQSCGYFWLKNWPAAAWRGILSGGGGGFRRPEPLQEDLPLDEQLPSNSLLMKCKTRHSLKVAHSAPPGIPFWAGFARFLFLLFSFSPLSFFVTFWGEVLQHAKCLRPWKINANYLRPAMDHPWLSGGCQLFLWRMAPHTWRWSCLADPQHPPLVLADR